MKTLTIMVRQWLRRKEDIPMDLENTLSGPAPRGHHALTMTIAEQSPMNSSP
jgi:hypothetical protein